MTKLLTSAYYYKDGTPIEDNERNIFMTNDVFEFVRRSAEVFTELHIWTYEYSLEDFHTDRTDLVYIGYCYELLKMRACDLEEYLKRDGRHYCVDICNIDPTSLENRNFTFWTPEGDN